MKMCKVSVIIPLYNVEKYIERCACSLFEQTLGQMEYIFVDDCSTDRSVEILQTVVDRYPVLDRVILLHHDKNRGVSAARNTGLKHASGDYIGWVDADDRVEKEMFEWLYQYARMNACDFVYCGYIEERSNGTCINHTKIDKEYPDSLERVNALVSGDIDAFLWNKLIKRSLLESHQIIFPEGYDMWEDFLALVSIVYYAKHIGSINKPLYHYGLRKGSVSLECSEKQLNAMFRNLSCVEDFLNDINASEETFLNLVERKFCIKDALLFQTGNTEQWRSLFPEMNKYIWKQNACWQVKLYEWSLSKHINWVYPLYKAYRHLKTKAGRGLDY